MTKKMNEIVDRGLPILNTDEIAKLYFGHNASWFNQNMRNNPKFIRNVPDIGLNRPEWKRVDVERFVKQSGWM
ncbi:hypothetical protein ESZ50_01445 [Weissella muntiaci]|uniref:DNA-binding protein n=1 Tax=Weissella muntiaci TaxID=2508881 RepID=A0A6C2CBQ6_9LACO|nr:hypothetical protein [Weissella muntiaci]TYC50909.1 hypothetical protein ESZ50_01445 [Weissella muntiaci]